jgi:peptide/nickel transport system substrate-binding protein
MPMRAGPCLLALLLAATLPALYGCRNPESGPIDVVAIGGAPRLVNPNREPVDAGSAFLMQAAAQGLVRFDSAGEIEPALAQRWIVSDDGLRYTFRLRRAEWPGGERITAEQVAARLRAAASGSSRNPVKPILGAIQEIVAMTDEVLEISLKSPRPGFLQLLAQPEMAVIRNGAGTGPYRATLNANGAIQLSLPPPDEDEGEDRQRASEEPPILLSGAGAAIAAARFRAGEVDLVIGGTAADLPIALAAGPAGNSLIVRSGGGDCSGFQFAAARGRLAPRKCAPRWPWRSIVRRSSPRSTFRRCSRPRRRSRRRRRPGSSRRACWAAAAARAARARRHHPSRA